MHRTPTRRASRLVLIGLGILACVCVAHSAAAGTAPTGPPSVAYQLRATLNAPGGVAGDGFGSVIAPIGDFNGDGYPDFAVAAPNNGVNGAAAGRVYIYYGGPAMHTVPDLVLNGLGGAGEQFGASLSGLGDWNGDGYADLVVGAPGYSSNTGRVYFFLGGASPSSSPYALNTGPTAGAQFGFSVAGTGDLDGDGRPDYVVGSPQFNGGTGQVWVFLSALALSLNGSSPSEEFGYSLAAAGDVNGDGLADFIVGAPLNNAVASHAGRAYVYRGARNGLVSAIATLSGVSANDEFGYSVAGAGDVNGDGYADVVVGAPFVNSTLTGEGSIYAFYGGPSMDATADVTLIGNDGQNAFMGSWVAGGSDLNQDGYADMAAAAPNTTRIAASSGEAQLFFGGTAPSSASRLLLTSSTTNGHFGTAVAMAGDLFGDGFPDLVAGTPGTTSGTVVGSVSVYNMNRYFLASPGNAVTWNVGSRQTVSWSGAEPADISLSVDGGATYTRLLTNMGGQAVNSVQLRVPHMPSRFCRLQITPTAGLKGSAATDSLFAITTNIALLGLKAQLGNGGADVSWSTDPPVAPEGIAGYRLYRIQPGGPAEGLHIGPDLITETRFSDPGAAPGTSYRLTGVDGLGEEYDLGRVGLGEASAGLRAWPSPVRSGTALHVAFAAGTAGQGARQVDLAVFDLAGRRVATLAPDASGAATWNGRDARGQAVAPGVYFVRASAPGFSAQRKVVLF